MPTFVHYSVLLSLAQQQKGIFFLQQFWRIRFFRKLTKLGVTPEKLRRVKQ